MNDHVYTPLFCEENIWMLLDKHLETSPLNVLFIINQNSTVALYKQKICTDDQPAIWDYHVILSATNGDRTFIYDFDSNCKFPCEINTYFEETFNNYNLLKPEFQAWLRVIEPIDYRQHFISTREHMTGVIPESEFPKYEAITSSKKEPAISLLEYKDISLKIDNTRIIRPFDYLK